MTFTSTFTHLHVASGYSLRYGASTPAQLVEVAAGLGMQALALTDRDGLYGAIKFVLACQAAGVSPVLGVDLAVESTGVVAGLPAWADPSVREQARRTPAKRGAPVSTLAMIADHARLAAPDRADDGPPALVVLLGPDSEVGRAALARRPDLARAVLERWRSCLPASSLAVEVVCHHAPVGRPTSVGHAARMLAVAREAGVPAVLTNAVRYATPDLSLIHISEPTRPY